MCGVLVLGCCNLGHGKDTYMGPYTGRLAEKDGIYICNECKNPIRVQQGEPFPPCHNCSWAVGFELLREIEPK